MPPPLLSTVSPAPPGRGLSGISSASSKVFRRVPPGMSEADAMALAGVVAGGSSSRRPSRSSSFSYDMGVPAMDLSSSIRRVP